VIIINNVKCPYCGFKGEFKLLRMWKYSWWDVCFYERLRCGVHFTSYVDPEGMRRGFVISYKPKVRENK